MSFKEYTEVKLADLCDLISRGITPSYTDDKDEGIIVLNQKCIRDNTINLELARLTNPNKKKVAENKLINKYDILVNSTGVGTLGRVAQIKNLSEKMTVDSHVTIVRPKKEINPIFLGYNLFMNQKYIESLGEGSTGQTELSRIRLGESLKIIVPSTKEQESIAKILSDLDEKIETNNQINKRLEEMAQAIFKQWFVDFEFPNEDGEPYKFSGGEMVESEIGMIPKGWEVAKIGDVTTIIRGASPRPIQDFMSEKGMPWLKISDATSSQGKYIIKIKEFIKEEGISKSRKVTQGTLVLSNSATPGMAKIMLLEACVHDGWLIFNDYKKISKEFMYYYLVKERERILSLSNGSVFRNLKTDILKNYPIIIPNEEVIKKMNSIYVSINEDIKKRTLENEKLETIRDALLPKLMSGEIRLPLNN